MRVLVCFLSLFLLSCSSMQHKYKYEYSGFHVTAHYNYSGGTNVKLNWPDLQVNRSGHNGGMALTWDFDVEKETKD